MSYLLDAVEFCLSRREEVRMTSAADVNEMRGVMCSSVCSVSSGISERSRFITAKNSIALLSTFSRV